MSIQDHFRAGTGEPVLLIHGFTATWPAWGPVPQRLAEHADVLAITLPGHTGGPELPEGKSISILVDEIEAMLGEVGWETAHLAGFSLGGWLSFELAKRGRARSVTAIAPGGATTERHAREALRIKYLFARLHRGAVLLDPILDEVYRRPRARRWALRDQMVRGELLRPDEAAGLTRAFARTPVFRRFLKEIGGGEGLDELEKVTVPVTILWGERDRVLPLKLHGRFYREGFPQARFEVLPDAGHVPFWEATDPIVAAIAAQLQAPVTAPA